jgi:hypothetical protein
MTKETPVSTQTRDSTSTTTTTTTTLLPEPDAAETQPIVLPGDPPLTSDAEGNVTGGEAKTEDEDEDEEERRR